jgi:hypothetical protein
MNTRTLASDFSEWETNQIPSAEDLMCLLESDAIVAFAIDGMTEDACDNWLKGFKEPNPEFPIAPTIVDCIKHARLFGDSICVKLPATIDENSKLTDLAAFLEAPEPEGFKPVGLDWFHPICDGDGYGDPSAEDLDEMGNFKYYHVQIAGVTKGKGLTIHASHVILFPGKKTRRKQRGICDFIASLDDIIRFRLWREAYGERAYRVAVPIYHWNKKVGKWETAEKSGITAACGEGKAVVTTGETTVGVISPPLTPDEINSTAIKLLQMIANDLGVFLNDIAELSGGGEKYAPDSNQSTYWKAIASLQKRYEPYITKVLKAFGLKFEGWNSPWEESLQQQIINMNALAQGYNNSSDPEVKAILKAHIVTNYGEKIDYTKYLAEERANSEREATRLDAFARSGGNARNGDGGRDGSGNDGDARGNDDAPDEEADPEDPDDRL